jgi:hypothetical protein
LPRATRTAIARDTGGLLRIHLTAAPAEGEANRALLDLLADRLHVPKSALEIRRGGRGRNKLVCVHGCSSADIDRLLSHVPASARSRRGASSATAVVDKKGRRG